MGTPYLWVQVEHKLTPPSIIHDLMARERFILDNCEYQCVRLWSIILYLFHENYNNCVVFIFCCSSEIWSCTYIYLCGFFGEGKRYILIIRVLASPVICWDEDAWGRISSTRTPACYFMFPEQYLTELIAKEVMKAFSSSPGLHNAVAVVREKSCRWQPVARSAQCCGYCMT